ncbi:MAG: ATP-binding protein [Chthoniobacterales bacterium]
MNRFSATASDSARSGLRGIYRQQTRRDLIRSLITANVLAIIGVPSGAALDYFLYPHLFGYFLWTRLGVVAFLAVVTLVLIVKPEKLGIRWVTALGLASVLSMTAAFSAMVYLTDGGSSPYFAGVILVMVCWVSVLPWNLGATLGMSFASLAFYLTAGILNPVYSGERSFALLGFGGSFILITTMVCAGITVFRSRTRFADFCLRHELDEKNRELQDLDRLKTQFFSNVSHELRTPLTLILGPAENLLQRGGDLEPAVHDAMMLIQRNTLRLLKLINDLLDLTRMDQGAAVLRCRPVAVDEFLRGVVESVRHLGLTKRLRMKIEAERTDLVVDLDPARVEKVLLNLLTNAIKYTPSGGTITVKWQGDGEGLRLEVEDTGVGIPEEDLVKVFDRFHQVRSNAANQNQGVGIGLALARELVEQHGGTLEVASEVGHGTTFVAKFPAGNAAAAGSPELVESASLEGVVEIEDVEEPFEKAFRSADRSWTYDDSADTDLPEMGSGPEVVLVADDEHDMRRYIVSLLAEDYRVVQTQHGGNVVDLVGQHRPSLVVLDWMMPGKDGLALCRELRSDEANRDLRIVLLTARADEESKINALKAGADDFLTKPFSGIEVRTRIGNLLRTGRMQRDLRASNGELSETLDRLRKTETLLVQSEKMNAIGSLSAGLLHEINNPLNYTLTAISIAKQCSDSLSPDMQEIIADVDEGMTRIRDIMADLKAFAYPEKVGSVDEVAVKEVVRSALKIAAGELSGVEIDVDLPEGLVVRGQKTPLIHVFINLLNNASRAIREGGAVSSGRVEVRGVSREGEAVITVSDNGPGIPADVLPKIFDAFFTTRDVGTGMGMGLSICNTILESHSGSIRAANSPNGGAVFTLEIPLAEMALIPC